MNIWVYYRILCFLPYDKSHSSFQEFGSWLSHLNSIIEYLSDLLDQEQDMSDQDLLAQNRLIRICRIRICKINCFVHNKILDINTDIHILEGSWRQYRWLHFNVYNIMIGWTDGILVNMCSNESSHIVIHSNFHMMNC